MTSPERLPTRLDQLEQLARIASYLLVPVVIGVGGWFVQQAIDSEGTRRAYVQIAISVLADKDADPLLRPWAAQLLAHHSPLPLAENLVARLGRGDTILSKRVVSEYATSGPVTLTVSPDTVVLTGKAGQEAVQPK